MSRRVKKPIRTEGQGFTQIATLVQSINNSVEDDTRTFLNVSEIKSRAQVRRVFVDIDELAQSLKHEGQKQPIVVAPKDKDGFYVILQGERRWRAAKLAGIEKLWAYVDRSQQTEADIRLAQLTENIQRDNMLPLDIRDGIASLIEAGISRPDIAARLGKSEATIQIYTDLMKAPAVVTDLCDIEKWGEGAIKDATTLRELSRLVNDDAEVGTRLMLETMEKEGTINRKRAKELRSELKLILNPLPPPEEPKPEPQPVVKPSPEPVETVEEEEEEGGSPFAEEPEEESEEKKEHLPQPKKREPEPGDTDEEDEEKPITGIIRQAAPVDIPPLLLPPYCSEVPFGTGEGVRVVVAIFKETALGTSVRYGCLTPNAVSNDEDYLCITLENGHIERIPNSNVDLVKVVSPDKLEETYRSLRESDRNE